MKMWPGQSYPLGAVYDGNGTNFSIFSQVATRVELCLFEADGKEIHLDLPEVTGDCWHGHVPTIEPGQRYGFRVHGPWDPSKGLRCNPSKLLLDPYTKALDGMILSVLNSEVKDIGWFNVDGQHMTEENWSQWYAKAIGLFLNGQTIPNPNLRGEPRFDDNFYIIFNAHHGSLTFTLPSNAWGEIWLKELDTHVGWLEKAESLKARDQVHVEPCSIVVFRNVP
jgi:pullulanase/glycogen debranching enzyme